MAEFKYIEVQKSRDFGQILNVTFSFISQNFRSLGKSILYIGGIPLLFAILFSVFIMWDISFETDMGEGNLLQFFVGFLDRSFFISWPMFLFPWCPSFI